MSRKHSFPPVVNDSIKVLVLGSLPGEESLKQTQYYAHPQNRFWELIGSSINEDLRSLDYDIRLQTLLRHHIGLWDVIADASRSGSLDSAIRNEKTNDLEELVKCSPKLCAVAFNGKKASTIGTKLLKGFEDLRIVDLPSSSPAYAAMPYDEKQSRWAVIRDIVG